MQLMPKTFLIDVDGVCADFTGHLLSQIDTHLKPEDITDWNIFGFMTPEEKQRAETLLRGPSFWKQQPVLPGAYEAVDLIRTRGHKVLFVTSPWPSCTKWGHSRAWWLKRNMATPSSDVIICSQKEHVCGDVFIDDKPEHVEHWKRYHPDGMSLLFKQPYNKGDFEWSLIGAVLNAVELREVAGIDTKMRTSEEGR